MYISMHALQSIPPSCLNRDQENRPKTCVYGGVERMRISSQCFKAAMRKYFSEHMDSSYIGIRTKYVPQQLAEEICRQNPEITNTEAMELSLYCLNKLGLKPKETEEEGEKVIKLQALMFVSRAQLRKLAELVSVQGMDVLEWDDKSEETKELKKNLTQAIQGHNSIDLALFGRMVADNKNMGVEGCMDVAQIIGVSELVRQEDFYTAVDECNPRDDAGAGMMGDTLFVSDVAYRYACINTDELDENLSDEKDIKHLVIKEVIRAFICAEPSARQHSMAAHVLPEYVRVEVRRDPMSYASAFEVPVDYADDLMAASVRKLENKAEKFAKAYTKPDYIFVLNLSDYIAENSDAYTCKNVDELAGEVTKVVAPKEETVSEE